MQLTAFHFDLTLSCYVCDLLHSCYPSLPPSRYILFSPLRVLSFVGPLVVTVEYILTKEISRFLIVYVILLSGFWQAFYIIYTTDHLHYQWQFNETMESSGAGFSDGSVVFPHLALPT